MKRGFFQQGRSHKSGGHPSLEKLMARPQTRRRAAPPFRHCRPIRAGQRFHGALRQVNVHRAFVSLVRLASSFRFLRKAAISPPFLKGPTV